MDTVTNKSDCCFLNKLFPYLLWHHFGGKKFKFNIASEASYVYILSYF